MSPVDKLYYILRKGIMSPRLPEPAQALSGCLFFALLPAITHVGGLSVMSKRPSILFKLLSLTCCASLALAASVCLVIAFWDRLTCLLHGLFKSESDDYDDDLLYEAE